MNRFIGYIQVAFCYVLPASETGWMKIATLMSALYTTTTWNT